MRWCYIAMIGLALALLTGCNEEQTAKRQDGNLDVELVKTLNNIGVENAIITQHTLYPYHFTTDAKELNELGQRDLAVLAGHFREHPGTLNIARGEVTESLYQARIASVLSNLKAAGVKTDRLRISEGMPGGTGMASERVVTILEKEPERRITAGSGTTEMSNR